MSNKLKDLIAEIKFKTKLTQAEIAERVDYTRPYLSNAIKSEDDKHVINKLTREFNDYLQDVRKSNIPEMENETQENTASLQAVITDLVATNKKLTDMLERSMLNSDNQQHISVTLEPLLHQLALAGVGKFWKDYDAGRIELNKMVTSTSLAGVV